MKEIIYNPAFMLLNDIKLTRNESLILNELIVEEVVGFDDLNEITGSKAKTRASSVTINRLRKKISGIIKIETRRGAGYFIKDKSKIKLRQGEILKPIQYKIYRLNVEEYIDKIFNDYKRDIDEAEKILKERIKKIL